MALANRIVRLHSPAMATDLLPDLEAAFPRGTSLPAQSPLFWVGQKDRYLRQLLIRDIEKLTGRRLLVYFANRFRPEASIDDADPAYFVELLGDVVDEPVDLLIETNGGKTDSTEAVVALIQNRLPDFRTIVANAAKSNGTLLCLASNCIVMGPPSELGPIDPHLQGIPCTVLADPIVASSNFPLHELAKLGLKQTEKLAVRLLKNGMLKTKNDDEINRVVHALATRNEYFSHGSAIDHREASQLGLNVRYLENHDPLWQRLWLLYTMLDFDTRRDNFIKIFEGAQRSTSIRAEHSELTNGI